MTAPNSYFARLVRHKIGLPFYCRITVDSEGLYVDWPGSPEENAYLFKAPEYQPLNPKITCFEKLLYEVIDREFIKDQTTILAYVYQTRADIEEDIDLALPSGVILRHCATFSFTPNVINFINLHVINFINLQTAKNPLCNCDQPPGSGAHRSSCPAANKPPKPKLFPVTPKQLDLD